MRRTDSIASLLAIAGIALLLGGCRQQTELPDLSGLGAITTISMEDGSGTKAELNRNPDQRRRLPELKCGYARSWQGAV